MTAFMSYRTAATVADRAENNARVTQALLAGWPMIDCSDLIDGDSDGVPHFGLVYAVLWTATVAVWLKECRRLFVIHESRSLVFSEQLPAGYLAALFETWPQLEHLAGQGRDCEDYTLPYIGSVTKKPIPARALIPMAPVRVARTQFTLPS